MWRFNLSSGEIADRVRVEMAHAKAMAVYLVYNNLNAGTHAERTVVICPLQSPSSEE
jgi:hypothetical protein